jgi:hypothetical protein
MGYFCIQLNDLFDKVLLTIFKRSENIVVLYFLVDENTRLNKIVHDSILTRDLKLLWYLSYNSIYPLVDPILDPFCLQILAEIHDKIKWL